MIIYLKNMAGHKMEHFKGMTYSKVRPIFEREYKKVQTLFNPDKDVEEPKKKRVADETLLQESFKKLRAAAENMLEIIPVSEFKVEALQVKYPIIDSEIHTEGSRKYRKIIRVCGITETYKSFEDMVKGFNKEDLATLWNLVKENFSSAVPSVNKEKALWVELKRLFEPNANDVLWKLQRVCGITETYKSFEDMVKGFDKEDLATLWNLVKENFSSAVPSVNKEKALWVELKRKNMIIYLKNMDGHKMEHFKGMTYMLEFKVEALQVKYPIIDSEIHTEGLRKYRKIIRVCGITETYKSFEDMVKGFDKEDLATLWNLVKENFSSAVPSVNKEKALWVELKRLFEPNANDVCHDPDAE
nr:hypothetical protein [Tanacetum cinerariifolium]